MNQPERKITVSDEELEVIANRIRLSGFHKVQAAVDAMRDLRDRYEGLGKYGPPPRDPE